MRMLVALCCTLVAVTAVAEPCDSVSYEHLGLAGPCIVEKFDMFADGGSYGGVIRDSEGSTLEIAWGPPPDEQHLWTYEMCSMVVYVDAHHFTDKKARALPVGGETEAELIATLQCWVDTQFEPSFQDSARYIDCVSWHRDQRRRYEAFWSSLSREQLRALEVLYVVRYLRAQRGPEDETNIPGRWGCLPDQSPPN